MKDIFVSYSRKDNKDKRVSTNVNEIEKELGSVCWVDREGIESGETFEKKIKTAIEDAKVVLFMMSDNSLLSEWTYKELSYAKEKGKKLVPITLDGQPTRAWLKVMWGNLDCKNMQNPEEYSKLMSDLKEWIGLRTTFVRKTDKDAISVKLPDGEIISMPTKNDTFIACLQKVDGKQLCDANITINDKPLISKYDINNVPTQLIKIKRSNYYVLKMQGRNITEALKQISDVLNLGWTIYSIHADVYEPKENIVEKNSAYYYSNIDDLDVETILNEANTLIEVEGRKAKESQTRAIELYKKAAAAGSSEAWNRLGIIYTKGINTEIDDTFAFQCFCKSSELGFSFGTLNLGYAYLYGRGVASDIEKAMKFFDEFIGKTEANNEELQDECIAFAKELPEQQSIKYYRKAAELGSKLAQNYLDAVEDLKHNIHSHPFEFVVEDIFSITGRGTIVTGLIYSGYVAVGEEVTIFNEDKEINTVIIGVEYFRKLKDKGIAGDNVGLLLRDVDAKALKEDDTIMHTSYVSEHGIDILRNELYEMPN